jgi:26S proteasome regulatory subunit N5
MPYLYLRLQVIVRRASEMLNSRSSREEQIELIKVLQGVTEGKIFVEIDRARLTKRLARILEGDNKVKEAADAMQEVAVETFGAMHRSEKIAYVLEQMRLCMDKGDFIRAQILSRKVRLLAARASCPR